MKKKQCTHAWETIQQCFECGAIREWQPNQEPIAGHLCPVDPMIEAETRNLINGLADEDWRGKTLNIKNAIFKARKLAGWSRTQWTR
jgi:iron uptake system EfeUOB component EfeO/EfeM